MLLLTPFYFIVCVFAKKYVLNTHSFIGGEYNNNNVIYIGYYGVFKADQLDS